MPTNDETTYNKGSFPQQRHITVLPLMLTNDDATYTKASFSQQRHFKDLFEV